MNPGFDSLYPHPFERLALLRGTPANSDVKPLNLSVGEPKHPTPQFILDEIANHLAEAGKYPPTRGLPGLRQAVRDWLIRRYRLSPDHISPEDHVLPITGTREALFAIAHCVVNPRKGNATVVLCNPFYQIYEGAALLAGARPWYVNTTEEHANLPDYDGVDAAIWQQCQLLYVCSPNNPTGEILDQAGYERLFKLADQYGFVIAADECYSEIYLDEARPPLGVLEAAAAAGRTDFQRCLAFHSLSKRSNLPGLRSGFVAGDKELIHRFYRYRTYHGCAMPLYAQAASIAAWNDEVHVIENRRLYREKFDAVLALLQPVMKMHRPSAGFYLWPETPVDDVEFTRQLIAKHNLQVLPGSFNARTVSGVNPGSNRIRIALVATLPECIEAANRIKLLLNTL